MIQQHAAIPKTIHYCWFGGNPLPELAKKCIASWRKFLPDFEIKEWNESNFDLSCCPYVREAYEAKKYAFVSDYTRFWILEKEGGLYFDVDVEVVKPLDEILQRGAFMGCEGTSPTERRVALINPGLGMGMPRQLPFLQEILSEYHRRHFLHPDGSQNLTTIVETATQALLAHGLREELKVQRVADIWIYPPEYFCPINYYTGRRTFTLNTHTIHHYAASWVSGRTLLFLKVKQWLYRFPPLRFIVQKIKQC